MRLNPNGVPRLKKTYDRHNKHKQILENFETDSVYLDVDDDEDAVSMRANMHTVCMRANMHTVYQCTLSAYGQSRMQTVCIDRQCAY